MLNIIGEVSANHGNSLAGVEKAIDELVCAGCNFVKFQLYTSASITIPLKEERFLIKTGPWAGNYLVDLYEKGGLDYSLFRQAVEYGKKLGVSVFASVFDFEALELCLELEISTVKIASAEAWDINLIRHCLKEFKTVIVSLGMASWQDIQRIYECAKKTETTDKLVLMHCISGYPAEPTEYKLENIRKIHSHFGTLVGLSDHTIGEEVAILSIALGATWFEKHYIPSNVNGSLDEHFSADFESMQRYVNSLRRTKKIISQADFNPTISEVSSLDFRRGLYYNKDLKSGSIIQASDLISRRPSIGLKPYQDHLVLGQILKRNVSKFDAVLLSDIDEIL